MLSKSKGQILRVAATFHVLFTLKDPAELEISSEISEEAIAAAIKFIQLCCQQTAHMAGRGDIKEEIGTIKASMLIKIKYLSFSYCSSLQVSLPLLAMKPLSPLP